MTIENKTISRRQWVSLVSAPVLAAGLSSCSTATRSPSPSPVSASEDSPNTLGARTYNVRDFGAIGDGKILDTKAIQAAIDACAKDHGGTVLLPAGDFLAGTLELKSNITFHISAGGRLLGSTKREDYYNPTNLSKSNGNCVLLFASAADNITIEGPGTIDGQGAAFFTGHGDGTGPGGSPSTATQPNLKNVDRPHLLVFYKCTNLYVHNIFLTRSAYHCFRILFCKCVQLDAIHIHNRVNLNNDGFHFNDTEYANVSNCNIQCQDDACALFGSCKFITVTNCSFSTRWSCFRFGGGEAENITVSNCLIYDTYGCPIKMAGGRGRFENISFSNIIMKNVTGPITVNLNTRGGRNGFGSATQPAAQGAATQPTTRPTRGIVRNISFSNIRATVIYEPVAGGDMPIGKIYPGEQRQCIVINGARPEDMIENISLSDIHATFVGGGTLDEAHREVPLIGGEYFQIGTPPAYGIYARNVRGLTLDNIRLEVTNPDLRPAVVLDHVEDAAISNISADGNPDADAIARFINSKDILITAPRALTPASTFLQVEGAASETITVDGGSIAKAGNPFALKNGALENTVTLRA